MSASNYANGVLGVFSVSPDSVRLHGTEGGLQWFPEGLKQPFRSEAVGQGQRSHPQAFPASRPTILAVWFANTGYYIYLQG